uniref:RRM domain-containing protein n=1 Tax=Aegilops tauschii subsp. strangulata TaxID=200361 RepID=A0A453BTX9_AEGTS
GAHRARRPGLPPRRPRRLRAPRLARRRPAARPRRRRAPHVGAPQRGRRRDRQRVPRGPHPGRRRAARLRRPRRPARHRLAAAAPSSGRRDAARVRRLRRGSGRGRAPVPGRAGPGRLVFDDRLQALLRRHEKEGGAVPAELAAPYRPGDADEEGEGGRSLFITFSKGFPLTREEISAYFTERWGEGCVESVMIERAPPLGEPPRYGRVAFRWASVAEAVLGGQRLVKLLVNGRQLWARKYVPKP